jgi:hypothetical protein
MSKTLKILKQIDEEEIPKAFLEARKHSNSPEAISRIVDKIVDRSEVSNPSGKALLANFVNGMLLGEVALDEIPELAILSPEERAKLLKKTSYSGMDELRDSVESTKFKYPKLGNKLDISPEYNPKFWGMSDRSGILLHQPSDVPLNFLTGVNLHEYGHQYDDAIRLALKKIKHLQTLDLKDPSVSSEYNKTKSALFEMWKKYPEIERTVTDQDLPSFKSNPYNVTHPRAAAAIGGVTSPNELSKSLTAGHMFKRNYEFDNLVKALKGGMKTVKGVGIGMIPAAAAGAIAAYSPDSMAGEAAKTSMKIMEEGDPLSMLMPSKVNENEEADVEKMIQEQKAIQAPGSTEDKWYGRRWSKIKDSLGK